MTACPHCRAAERQVKSGFNRAGSQRYLCRLCRRTYTPDPKPPGYDEATKLAALDHYAGYLSLRITARLLSINHQTVVNWADAAYARALASGATDELSARVVARRELEVQTRRWQLEFERLCPSAAGLPG